MFNRSIVAVALILTLIASGTRASGPLVILDTDYRSDVDDVGALAMMHALQDRGEGTLIGVIGTTSGPNIAASIDAVNTYYGRSTIPVGLVTDPPSPTPGSDDFTPALANPLRYASQQTNASAPDSTALYRQLLNQAPDNSVKIVVVGGQTAVSRLLDSPANDNNDGINLTGKQLIASKVSQLVVMGGRFSSGNKSEFNINLDVTSANNVANNWPSPVVYSGFEVGVNVKTGAGLTNQKTNPVAQAYDLYRGTDGGKGTVGDRSRHHDAVFLPPQWRTQPEECAVGPDIVFVERDVVDRHPAGHVKPALLGPADQVERIGTRDLRSVITRARQFHEPEVPLNHDRFGLRSFLFNRLYGA